MKLLVKIFLINLMTVTTILYGTKEPTSDAFIVHAHHDYTEFHAKLGKDYFR